MSMLKQARRTVQVKSDIDFQAFAAESVADAVNRIAAIRASFANNGIHEFKVNNAHIDVLDGNPFALLEAQDVLKQKVANTLDSLHLEVSEADADPESSMRKLLDQHATHFLEALDILDQAGNSLFRVESPESQRSVQASDSFVGMADGYRSSKGHECFATQFEPQGDLTQAQTEAVAALSGMILEELRKEERIIRQRLLEIAQDKFETLCTQEIDCRAIALVLPRITKDTPVSAIVELSSLCTAEMDASLHALAEAVATIWQSHGTLRGYSCTAGTVEIGVAMVEFESPRIRDVTVDGRLVDIKLTKRVYIADAFYVSVRTTVTNADASEGPCFSKDKQLSLAKQTSLAKAADAMECEAMHQRQLALGVFQEALEAS